MIAHASPSYAERRLDEALAAIGETRALFTPNQYGNLLRTKAMSNARIRVYRLMLEPRGQMPGMSVNEISEACGVSHSSVFELLKRGRVEFDPSAAPAAMPTRDHPWQPDEVLDGIEAALACIAKAEHSLKDSEVRSEVVRAVIHLERAMALADREIVSGK